MGPAALGTAAGAAALTVGRGVLGTAAGGLSFVAELAKAAGGLATDETPTAEAADRIVKERVAAIEKRIQQHLTQAGIRLTTPVELTSNGTGGIAVVGPHPEQAAIEEALSTDLLLERDFHQLAAETPDFRLTIRP